jgi:hypothetical protein
MKIQRLLKGITRFRDFKGSPPNASHDRRPPPPPKWEKKLAKRQQHKPCDSYIPSDSGRDYGPNDGLRQTSNQNLGSRRRPTKPNFSLLSSFPASCLLRVIWRPPSNFLASQLIYMDIPAYEFFKLGRMDKKHHFQVLSRRGGKQSNRA